ncbi:hypothetical protein EW145_g6388 [Phellinidium pouzarii]|uniref:Gluconokinase n=1 Tax=Phellinidium pouzarii TaxID=167371 RepID=A0A4S4KWR2_9AGAM|nr:hypothetical protein EW145_g6388 [Phellinidium pouzarii]
MVIHSEPVSTYDRPTNRDEHKQHTHDDHCAEDQLDALRSNTEHHVHHARGDVGGKYHDQEPGEDDGITQKVGDELRKDVSVKEHAKPILVVVMGVSACGKSTVGAALANALGMPFTDADALHPQSNIDKMSHGVPLTDADRQPWLERVREEAAQTCKQQDADSAYTGRRGIVIGCSSLKLAYRDILRGIPQSPPETESENADAEASDPAALPTYFVHIRGTRDALLQRLQNRKGHFMKVNMLDSQLATLDPPEETGEPNVVTIELEATMEDQVREAKDGLKILGIEV